MSRVLPFPQVISQTKHAQQLTATDPPSTNNNNNNIVSNNSNGQTGAQPPKFAKSSPSPMPKHVLQMSKSAVMTPKGSSESHEEENNVVTESPMKTP